MLVIATLPPDGARLWPQGGFETRPYMNPDPGTFIDATRGERLEAAHDFRNGVACRSPSSRWCSARTRAGRDRASGFMITRMSMETGMCTATSMSMGTVMATRTGRIIITATIMMGTIMASTIVTSRGSHS